MTKQKRKTTVKKTLKKRKPKKKTASGKKLTAFFMTVIVLAGLILFLSSYRDKLPISKCKRIFSNIYKHIENAKDSLTIKTWDATLYYGDENSDFLVKEFRSITSPSSPEKKASALINEIISGPLAKGVRTIPEQTMLRAVAFDEKKGLLKVDFSREISTHHPGGTSSEIMTVYSIVNTLITNIKCAKRVKISIEGKGAETIAGHIDCKESFQQNMKIVR